MKRMFTGLLAALVTLAGIAIAGAAPLGLTGRVPGDGVWQDQHQGYPNVPNGAAAIRSTFGVPCSADARANWYALQGADNNEPYTIYFHRLLGGTASSNLDNDIPGHITKAHLDGSVRSGIWGYNCRAKRGPNEYSAHAWGIAIDINTSYETPGTDCQSIPSTLGKIWTAHRWTWGAAWKDCMHFQYATGY